MFPIQLDDFPNFTLIQTCGACPEAYDVQDQTGTLVGTMRLRHGHFVVRAGDSDTYGESDVVFTAHPEGDGIFESDEREAFLRHGCLAIARKLGLVPRFPEEIKVNARDLALVLDGLDAHASQLSGLQSDIFKRAALPDSLQERITESRTGEVALSLEELSTLGMLLNLAQATL